MPWASPGRGALGHRTILISNQESGRRIKSKQKDMRLEGKVNVLCILGSLFPPSNSNITLAKGTHVHFNTQCIYYSLTITYYIITGMYETCCHVCLFDGHRIGLYMQNLAKSQKVLSALRVIRLIGHHLGRTETPSIP